MKPNFTNAFFQKTRCLRTVLRRAVVCMLLLGTTVVHAQERKITVDTRQEVTLVQLFRQVEASSDYLFNYKDQDVADIRVSVKVADASIQEVMDLALARTSLTYTGPPCHHRTVCSAVCRNPPPHRFPAGGPDGACYR